MKKMFKKFLASLMVSLMVLSAAPLSGFVGLELNLDWLELDWLDFNTKASAATYSGTCGENLTWSLDTSTGELVISGTGAMTYYCDSSNVPWCDYRSSIKKVTIGDSVTSIGDYAFSGCTGLTSITIPDSVTSIGQSAFYNCTSLTSITIPDGVTSIGDEAFSGCNGLTSATIGNSVTTIGYGAFSGCTALTRVTLPDSLTSIGWIAFYNCSGITELTMPISAEIGSNAFERCTNIEKITLTKGNGTVQDYGTGTDTPWYISGCSEIIIEDGVTSIGSNTFYDCYRLTTVRIGNSVTKIDSCAFEACTDLKTVYYNGTAGQWRKIVIDNGNESLLNAEIIFLVSGKEIVDSGDCGDNLTWTLYDDGDFVISGTGAMDHLDFDEAPWHSYRSLIKSVTIDNGVTSISPYTFYMCSNLTDVIISESVTSIGSGAFNGCTSLTSITIPGSVTSIGGYVFSGCDDLKTVYYNGTSEQWNSISKGSDILSGCDNCQLLFISDSGRFIFGAGECGENLIWTLYDDGELVISGTGEMTNYSYSGNTPWYEYYQSVKKVTVDDGVTTIGSNVFEEFYNLESVTIDNSIISIGDNAFYDCHSLTNVTIGNSVTSIGRSAFSGCTGLTSITIPDSVRSIENAAFGSTGITSIIIPTGVTYLDDRAFMNNKDLTVYYCGTKEQMDTVLSSNTASFYESFGFVMVYNYNPEQPTLSTGTCGENLTWSFDIETKELVISGTGAMTDYLDSWDIPWYSYRLLINKVIISDGATSVGEYTFNWCKNLESIEIAGSVTTIGVEAFAYCEKITSVTIPNGVKIIGDRAFCSCTSLETVTIPESVIAIGDYVFSGCFNIKNMSIPNGVKQIGSRTFNNCTSLVSVTIPESVTNIGSYVFEGCTSLECISVDENNKSYSNDEYGVLFNKAKTTLIKYPVGNARTGYTIPDSVTSISDSAFNGCTSLTNVIIPGGITCISGNTFANCTSLTSVTIPASVTGIGGYAFSNCTTLSDITIPATVISISEFAFLNCTSLTKVSFLGTEEQWNEVYIGLSGNEQLFLAEISFSPADVDVENNKSGICGDNLIWTLYDDGELVISGTGEMYMHFDVGDAPWYSERSLIKTVTIGDGVTSIGGFAFAKCINLTNITIPDTVTVMGNGAFYKCSSLTTVNIPDGVTVIGGELFNGCEKLTSITIPVGTTHIGSYAFNDCTALETVYYNGTQAQWNAIEIGHTNECLLNAEIIFLVSGREIIDSGECGENLTWTLYDDGELVISGTGEMNDYSYFTDPVTYAPWYSYSSSIKKLTIGNGVTSIGNWAFYDCTSLTSITIPNSVTSIGYSVFSFCTSLTSITIPDSVTSIGYSAFSECTSLTSITIGNGVASIGNRAFSYCKKLEEVIFTGDGVVAFGEEIFYGSPKAMICCEENSYLHTYAEANNMKFCLLDENGVPSFAVQNDVLLSYRGESTDVFVSAGTKIGYGAFENNSIVETVVLSSSVSRIHSNAFKNCTALETIIILENVTSIGAGAFAGCDNLTIWCYAGSYADSYATANGINVEYIALDIEKDILILNLKGTSSLTASLNTPYAENTGVVWSSTNTSLATVDGNGNVKGIKAGTAVIVATSKEGGLRDYCVVKVVGIEALSTATIDHENGTIMGLSSNIDSLDGYVEISDPAYNLSYDSLGTDSVVYVECDGEIVDAYTVIIFGDVNGDGWYDGMDAVLVSCLANGMLTKEDVGEAVYMAADCNHDGVIDQLDVELLNQAGMLLTNVDQSKPTDVLLETSSAYVEYISLIDQSPEIEIEDDFQDNAEIEPDDSESSEQADVLSILIRFFERIFEMILSFFTIQF